MIPFDECAPTLPPRAPRKIVPFGEWLLKQVKRVASAVEPALQELDEAT